MSAKLKALRADPNRIKALDIQSHRRGRDVLVDLMAERKAYRHSTSAARGRFSSQADLIVYLVNEVSKRERPRWAIAEDAGIRVMDLAALQF